MAASDIGTPVWVESGGAFHGPGKAATTACVLQNSVEARGDEK